MDVESTTGNTITTDDDEVPFGHIILLSPLVCFGLATNLLILFLIFIRRSLRLPCNVYIANKIVCDILILILAPFHLISMGHSSGWRFGQIGCQIIGSLDVLALFVSLHSLFALGHQIYAVFVKPKWDVDNRKVFHHNIANWIYCMMLVLPVPTTSYIFQWDGFVVCGYKWPPMQNYYAMYFISLFGVGFLGPQCFFIWWFCEIRKVPAMEQDDVVNKQEVKGMYRPLVTLIVVGLIRWIPYWVYHFTIMAFLGDNASLSFHVPGGTGIFNTAVSWSFYVVASSNIFVLTLTSANWRMAVKDALRLRFRDETDAGLEEAAGRGTSGVHVSVISVQPADEENSYDNAAMGGALGMIEMQSLG